MEYQEFLKDWANKEIYLAYWEKDKTCSWNKVETRNYYLSPNRAPERGFRHIPSTQLVFEVILSDDSLLKIKNPEFTFLKIDGKIYYLPRLSIQQKILKIITGDNKIILEYRCNIFNDDMIYEKEVDNILHNKPLYVERDKQGNNNVYDLEWDMERMNYSSVPHTRPTSGYELVNISKGVHIDEMYFIKANKPYLQLKLTANEIMELL